MVSGRSARTNLVLRRKFTKTARKLSWCSDCAAATGRSRKIGIAVGTPGLIVDTLRDRFAVSTRYVD